MKRAVVIGASSGIGKELAIILSQNGFAVGLMARRIDLLEELRSSLPNPAFSRQADISDHAQAMAVMGDLVEEMGGVDLVVISSGTGFINPDLDWEKEKATIDVNVIGFAAMANVAFCHFLKTGRGHLVGISSIAAIRGSGGAPAYGASKAFMSNYLEGLRISARKAGLSIAVTDIQPGFVDTAMAKGQGLFWVASPQKAARQIYDAIRRKARHAYVTKRWSVIGWLLKVLPDFIYSRL
jgi:short-subunit dehydrogenase